MPTLFHSRLQRNLVNYINDHTEQFEAVLWSNKTDRQLRRLKYRFRRSIFEYRGKMVRQFAWFSMVTQPDFVIKRFANF